MKSFLHILPLFFLLLLLSDCAKIGSPAGGPRDNTPPQVRKSEPLNETVQFNKKKIEITFDEYLKQDEIQQELIVSPPMEEEPLVKFRGKTMIIEFQEELRDSTTYTLNFGQSIMDLNEGNILPNFEFVFSTGGFVDSLAVLGSVRQAFDLLQPEEPVYLLLFEEPDDSSFYKDIPDYVSRADEKGAFLINHIRPSTYELYGLVDLNRNYIYDVPEELIAFLDTSISIHPSLFIDTLDALPKIPGSSVASGLMDSQADTAMAIKVSTEADSTVLTGSPTLNDTLDAATLAEADSIAGTDSLTLADLAQYSIFVDLFLFLEDRVPHYLSTHKREDRRTLMFIFSRPLVDSLELEPLNFDPAGDWLLFEPHVRRDTFLYWITDSSVYKLDSLTFRTSYLATDTLNELSLINDTLDFNFRDAPQKPTRRRRRENIDADTIEKINLSFPLGRENQDLNRPLNFLVSHPVSDTSLDKVSLVRVVDSLEYPVAFELKQDSLRFRKFSFHIDWEGITRYRLEILPGAFRDIYGLTHDTVLMEFQTRDPEYYGNIMLNIKGVNGPKIIQILDSKDNLLRWKTVGEDGMVQFDYMPAGEYRFKLIHDRNGNMKWDTGEFISRRQPEGVQFLPGKVRVRKNFDTEVEWDLNRKVKSGSDQPPPR